MSVERFEVGKTYRSGDGIKITVEWTPNDPAVGYQFVGYHWTGGGALGAANWRLADWTEVVPERHYEVVVRPAVEGDKLLNRFGEDWIADHGDIDKFRSVIVREWVA